MKVYKPTTPGQRQLILIDRKDLTKNIKPIKSLVKGVAKKSGHNNQGKITAFRKSGGAKRLARKVTFNRHGLYGVVEAIEYDPNRSAFLARLKTSNGYRYIIAPDGLELGYEIQSGPRSPLVIGNALPLKKMPVGSLIHNVELYPRSGGQFLRAAGTYGKLVEKFNDKPFVRITLPSKEERIIHEDSLATLGIVSNISHKEQKLGKAGRSRWKRRKPVVRGVAMNPADHPHGGGEGKTSGGRHPVTPWGRLTKGPKTRKTKKPNPFRIKHNFQIRKRGK